jgi:hypothetical protein
MQAVKCLCTKHQPIRVHPSQILSSVDKIWPQQSELQKITTINNVRFFFIFISIYFLFFNIFFLQNNFFFFFKPNLFAICSSTFSKWLVMWDECRELRNKHTFYFPLIFFVVKCMQVQSLCACSNEPSGSTKCWETIELLHNWRPLEYHGLS